MSLDSVELLVSFENYFGISIPDPEAEKINTVSEMTDSICHHLGIASSHTTLRDDVFAILKKTLLQTGLAGGSVNMNDYLKDFFNYNPGTWQQLERGTNLSIPPFPVVKNDALIGRIISRIAWTPQADYDTVTFSDFCDVVCAANHQKFLNTKPLSSRYEVYIAVMAITEDKTGVDLYEIKPDKSFTADFGID